MINGCVKCECINWDSDRNGGHCMCVDPPCIDPNEFPDEYGIPKKTTFALVKHLKNGRKHEYGTLDLTYDTLQQLENNFADFVNEYGNECGEIDFWEIRSVPAGIKFRVHAPKK